MLRNMFFLFSKKKRAPITETADGDAAGSNALVDNRLVDSSPPADSVSITDQTTTNRCFLFFAALKSGIYSLIDGYRIYFRQSVLPAGLALSSLYLTVLSFDGITTVRPSTRLCYSFIHFKKGAEFENLFQKRRQI